MKKPEGSDCFKDPEGEVWDMGRDYPPSNVVPAKAFTNDELAARDRAVRREGYEKGILDSAEMVQTMASKSSHIVKLARREALEEAVMVVEREEELIGEMPPAIQQFAKSDLVGVLRATVRATKSSIRSGIRALAEKE